MSNGQLDFHIEKPSIDNSEQIEKFNQPLTQNSEDLDLTNPKIENQVNDSFTKSKPPPHKREQTRKKREKHHSSDNFQDSDSFDDLDYTLENDMDFERKMRSNYGRSRYSKSGSNSRSSRLSNNGLQSNGRSGFDSKSHKSYNSNGTVHSGWKPEEDARLKEAIQLYGSLDWMKISNYVGNGRTRSQCSQRWHRCLDPHISKEKWSEDEIECLKNLVNEYGDRSWARIASKMEKRCDVQCRYMYKRIINKKNIRGMRSENLNGQSKSENDLNKNSEKVDLSMDEFEREIENDENFGVSNRPQQINLPQSNFFMNTQNDFAFQQPNFAQPMNFNKNSIFNNAFAYQNPYVQPNQMITNNNYAAKSIFPISDNVFSLFESQKSIQQPFKQESQSNVFNNQKQNQNSEPVIKTTPIDDFMAGLSSSSSSSFPSIRYKF